MELKSKQICRFCLTTNRPLVNIYKSNNQDVPLSLQVIACVSIEVFPSDKMPATICEACNSLMDFCYRFKQMCKEADMSLKMVPTTKIWPEALEFPQFTEGSPFQLLQQAEMDDMDDGHQVVEILDHPEIIKYVDMSAGEEEEEEEAAPEEGDEELEEEEDGEQQHQQQGEHQLIEEFSMNEVVEVDEFDEPSPVLYPEQVTRPALVKPSPVRRTVPKVVSSDAEGLYPPKVLNLVAKRKRPPIKREEPELKRNKFGNVDILLEEQPEVMETDVFPCKSCQRSFPLKQLLEIHERNHTRERESACELCPKKFFTKYDLAKHMTTHTKERPFKCVVCSKCFSRSTLLHRHQKIHSDVPRYDCDECDRFFFDATELDNHTLKHKRSRPFNCLYCPKSFAFKQGLERHEVVHAELQPYPCQYCDLSYNTRNKLLRHLVGHAGNRPFPCKYCPKSYLMSHHLTRHMRSHAVQENVAVSFTCYRCQQEFPDAEILVQHMSEQHETVDDLSCMLCNEQFETAEENRMHLMQHSEGDQFACEFCDLIFLDEEKLINHSQDEHADEHRLYEEDLAKTAGLHKRKTVTGGGSGRQHEQQQSGTGGGGVGAGKRVGVTKKGKMNTREPEVDLYWAEETDDVADDQFVVEEGPKAGKGGSVVGKEEQLQQQRTKRQAIILRGKSQMVKQEELIEVE